MAANDNFNFEKLPWEGILENLNQKYHEQVRRQFSHSEEIIALLLETGVTGMMYDPNSSANQENSEVENENEVFFWQGARKDLTTTLREILTNDYDLPPEDANLFFITELGAAYGSSNCWEWKACFNGRTVSVFCCHNTIH